MPLAFAAPRFALSCFTLLGTVLGQPCLALAATASPSAEIPVPPLATAQAPRPGVDALAEHPALPDALRFADGTLANTPAQWAARRAEITRTLTYYATGLIPPAPGNVVSRELKSATLLDGTVTYRLVHLSFGPEGKLGFDVAIFTPSAATTPRPTIVFPSFDPTPGGTPLPLMPKPAHQGKGGNALAPVDPPAPPAPPRPPNPAASDPAAVAAKHRELFARGYALVTYHYQDTGEDTIGRLADGSWAFRTTRQFPAYAGYDWGLLAGWAWGASRVVDYLVTQPFADPAKLILTGHSRIGKAVLVAGAFDERFAVVAPAGTGGGGTGAYRFSGAGRGGKEGLDDMMRKYPNWFSPQLHQFRGHADRLPFDQHWFIALVAPRAFISLDGDNDTVSLVSAVNHAARAALPVYTLLGAPQKLGTHVAPHGHAYAPEDWAALLDFADQQLFGKPATRRFDAFTSATP